MSDQDRWFSHSGDLGDIVYSLPAVKGCGGGVFYLFDMPGRTHHGMSSGRAELILPLLRAQPYISGAAWLEMPRDSNLNGFRDHGHQRRNLADMHLAAAGLDWSFRCEQWLQIPEIKVWSKVVWPRSFRYRSPHFPWRRIWERFASEAGFGGLPGEWSELCAECG